MGNANLKGRATAEFEIVSSITDGTLRIVVTADATSEDYDDFNQEANGTVALGRIVADRGKDATPITAADRRFQSQTDMYVNAGLSVSEAFALATQVNSL